jgi:hypothetical protein
VVKDLNFTRIREQAELFEFDCIGVVPVSAWAASALSGEEVEQTPSALWTKTQSVIVLGIRCPVDDAAAERLLNELACKMALWLNSCEYPSVYIPAGDLTANMPEGAPRLCFSHKRAGELAGLDNRGVAPIGLVSVLTAWRETNKV